MGIDLSVGVQQGSSNTLHTQPHLAALANFTSNEKKSAFFFPKKFFEPVCEVKNFVRLSVIFSLEVTGLWGGIHSCCETPEQLHGSDKR